MDIGTAHSLQVWIGNKKHRMVLCEGEHRRLYAEAEVFGNDALHTVADTIRNREADVLNYFIHLSANVFSESINARIQHPWAQLTGIADVSFFLFRPPNIFG